jgi:hypothetical protein
MGVRNYSSQPPGQSDPRDQQGEAFLDVILEGPAKWKLRPVLEVFDDNVWGLVGAIWQVRDNLSFDAGFRYALVNGRPMNEIRAGLTFGFDVGGPAANPGVAFGNWSAVEGPIFAGSDGAVVALSGTPWR